ncbi:MAG: peptide chain release factor 1 [Rhodospirillaceae bacterium]
MTKFEDRLVQIVSRRDELTQLLSSSEGKNAEVFSCLSREYSEISPIVDCIESLRALQLEISDLDVMTSDQTEDPDVRSMAEEELRDAKIRLADLERELQILLLPKDSADDRSAILEIRAGTGGDEASLFAADLYRMYHRYSDLRGWKFGTIAIAETEVGGIREAAVEITGKGVFARLKLESGVHRVQRVPETESGGRIHTSAATVAVLAEAEEVDIEILDKDLRIDTFRAQGAGGQHVNKTDSAVRITHIPSGIVVSQQDEKSQHKNRSKAMKILRARLYDAERRAIAEARAEDRKSQVGSGDRSERIRTYNFPQGRVTDHRISLTLHKLDKILAGEGLDEVVDALIAEDQATKLALL